MSRDIVKIDSQTRYLIPQSFPEDTHSLAHILRVIALSWTAPALPSNRFYIFVYPRERSRMPI